MKAVIYARYSSDNQREESIDAQVRAIEDYANRQAIQIVKIYKDESRSATTDQRPEFLKMMKEIETQDIHAVIVHKLDRFSRDRFDSAYYKRHMAKHGVRLISVLENLDGSPESIILESVLEGMAEYYSKNLAREVMKGMKETAYQCKHTGGSPPLGFDLDSEKHLTINEHEKGAVKLIFERYADGIGYNRIIDELNEKGYKTKLGNSFGKNSIHDILKNEKYRGVYVFNQTKAKSQGKRNSRALKAEDEIIRIEGGCPRIVRDELWERVQIKMKNNKKRPGANTAKSNYLLSGKIYCGKCGSAMVGNRVTGGRKRTPIAYYECNAKRRTKTCDLKSINKEYVENIVIDALYNNLFSDDVFETAVNMIHENAKEIKKEIPGKSNILTKRLKSVELEIKNLLDAVAAGMFHESMKIRLDELELSKQHYENELDYLQQQKDKYSMSKALIRRFLASFKNIKEATDEEKKKVIQLFVDKIYVYEDDLDIRILTTISEHKKSTTSSSKTSNGAIQTDSCVWARLVEAVHDPQRPNTFALDITIPLTKYRHQKRKTPIQ